MGLDKHACFEILQLVGMEHKQCHAALPDTKNEMIYQQQIFIAPTTVPD